MIATTIGRAIPPKLVVVCSFDQLRGDYFDQYRRYLRADGFRRFESMQGVVFSNSSYKHANNITGPGHAALLTGCYPHRSGITGNEFCDIRTGDCIYCCDDPQHRLSPKRLAVPTVGDVLRTKDKRSKVVSVAIKDRAAILMGGASATTTLWFDPDSLRYTTSSYYKRPAWLRSFNATHAATAYAGRTWHTSIPDSLDPRRDDQLGEGSFSQLRHTFPYTLPSAAVPSVFVADFVRSPFSAEHLFDLATTAIAAEQLGMDAHPDILCIGISTTDALGHTFGPDSREVQELFVRCDSLLAAFMHRCDSLVGPENYAVFVTADHGVGPIPEIIRDQARQQGAVIDAGRIRESQIAASLNTMLSKRYSTWDSVQWVREIYEPSIYLNYDVLSERHVNYDTLVQACVDHLASQPWVGIVTTKADLRRDKRPRDVSPELWTWLKNSFYADRYGDVVVYPKMYWVIGSAPATHGTPWIYDRMVPLMVLMPGAPNGGLRNKHDVFLDVSPVDIAPTIAAWYGLQLPSVDGKALPLECGK